MLASSRQRPAFGRGEDRNLMAGRDDESAIAQRPAFGRGEDRNSECFGHIAWLWVIELTRRDLRNRITHEPDAEVPLAAASR